MKLLRKFGLPLSMVALLAACGDGEVILPGERLDARSVLDGAQAQPDTIDAARPIALPAQVNHAEWTHKAGDPTHRIQHPAFGQRLNRAWSASIGQGNDRKHRITAAPIVAGGRVFTLDSRARVAATSTSGQPLWTADLTPANDSADDASGGGLAYSGGRLFVTTGFGELVALDPTTGGEYWTQKLEAAATGTPTVKGDLVYVVSRDSRGWAVDVNDGRIRWQVQGTPSVSNMVGGPGPAVTDTLAIFPFASNELVATLRQGGLRTWSSYVSGQRLGRAYANITDVTGDPVIVGDTLYTGNQSGRAVALDLSSGERIWTAQDGAYGPVWVTGGSVFLVSDQSELVRLDAETGERIWGVQLPYFRNERPRRLKAVSSHYGPVLAGGRLIVASNDGAIRAFRPEDGALLETAELPGGAASNMAVAGGTLYVVSGNGQLHAFR